MKRDNWIIRSYNDGDEIGYTTLMKIVFPGYQCSLERWRWEYKENPFRSLQVFAESDGKIVGHYGLAGVRVKIGDAVVQGSQGVDLAVHPEFRGRSFYIEGGKKIFQEAEKEGFLITYAIPSQSREQSRAVIRGHLRHGWSYVSEIPVLIKRISRRAFPLIIFSRLRDLAKQPSLKSILDFWALSRALVRTIAVKNCELLHSSGLRKRVVTSFDERFDRLWAEAPVQQGVLVVRDRRYLNWRYIERPQSDYLVLTVERNKKLEGYSVLSFRAGTHAGWKTGYIVDIFAKSEEGVRFLIQLACDYFAKAKVDMAICWMMKSQIHYSCLIEHGFVNDASNPQILICRINVDNNIFSELGPRVKDDWFFTIGDSDMV